MEYSPPPFFKTGPTPLARLLIFSALSLAFLVAANRFNYLASLRQIAAIVRRIGDFFTTHGSLREDHARLARKSYENAALLLQLKALQAENAQLRELLDAR